MTKINPNKLLNSKWTAITPKHREKHFIVTDVEFDEEGMVIACTLEAIISKRAEPIEWKVLTNNKLWNQGWK